uniref:Uncharacterized protein n=1 Tax=Amphiprion ocellaris TaxID=80972 RepID=A0AAQ5ZWT5_AMPOC
PLLRQADKDLQEQRKTEAAKIKDVPEISDLCDINTKRECVLRSLVIYFNEDPDSFFKEYLTSAAEDAERDIADTTMGIYTIRREGVEEPVDLGIVIEGIKVPSNIGNVILGFILLFGLIYALDLSFPDHMKYTTEFFQKFRMSLDGHKLNTKIQQLEIKLFP